jgi:hypothetical protein
MSSTGFRQPPPYKGMALAALRGAAPAAPAVSAAAWFRHGGKKLL